MVALSPAARGRSGLSTGGSAAPDGIRHSAPVRAIEVEPAALPSAADALRRFAAEIDGTPVLVALPGALAGAVAELIRTTARDLAAVGAEALDDAAQVEAAADTYRQLEALLIPDAMR